MTMNSRIRKSLDAKMSESLESSDEIRQLADSLRESGDSVLLGILVGRLYNSFYYQSRRVLKRDPTDAEFAEFADMIAENRQRFLEVLRV